MANRIRWIAGTGGVAATAALVWAFLPAPAQVDVATIARGAFEQTIDDDGVTRVRERYVVSAPLAGRLHRITLKAGDAVAAGAVVATITPAPAPLLDARADSELRARIGAAESALAAADAALARARLAQAQARDDAARSERLADQGFVSAAQHARTLRQRDIATREFDAASAERRAADYQLAQAQAARAASQTGGGQRITVRAPVAGRVLRIQQQSESSVPAGAPLIDIGNPEDIEVVVDVPTGDASLVRPGQRVHLDRPRDTPLAGVVRRIEPGAFTKVSALGVEEQRVNVVIDITTPRAQWRGLGDAYRVDARIVVDEAAQATLVPVAALVRDGSDWTVFVVDGHRARRRVLRIGRRGARVATVDSGLVAGERVVLYPGDSVRDGVRLRLRDRPAD